MTDTKAAHPYTADYFLRGKELGLSNYQDYRWLGELSLTFAAYVRRHLAIPDHARVLDVGCSRGYLVKALRMLNIDAYGYDISEWAIQNCDPDVKELVTNDWTILDTQYDFITAKDVLEHIPTDSLQELLKTVCTLARRAIFIVVPLTAYTGGRYIRDEDEADKTHIQRMTLSDWLLFLTKLASPAFTVSGSYYVKGVKECCKPEAMSCGFFTLTRI